LGLRGAGGFWETSQYFLEAAWHGTTDAATGLFYDAPRDVVVGTYDAVANPVQTIQGLSHAVQHPIQTADAIFDDVVDKASTDRGRGQLGGELIATLLGSHLNKVKYCKKLPDAPDPPCFVAGTLVMTLDHHGTSKLKPIESISVGDTVMAGNKGSEPVESTESDDWYVVSARSERTDVGLVEIELLKSKDEVTGLSIGGYLTIGAHAEGRRLRIDDIRRAERRTVGFGRLVTARTVSIGCELVILTFKSEANHYDCVTCTPGHRFRRALGGQWTPANLLRKGDILDALEPQVIVVDVRKQIRTPSLVYNLTVEGEHFYHVGSLKVAAHNDCFRDAADIAEKVDGGVLVIEPTRTPYLGALPDWPNDTDGAFV
jgi:hypothetical protein